ncbi:hypothetical protein HHK36_029129 [Tetracentron sinense]|uniref:protein-serine/threonine phosphatase n=1 Tax=Tetracentron sinense TaxID=13715 RepID=A0A834YGA2_TETSI|nr:hypothetical protein HHK36_029129 [Tetracentron sinense]
MVCNTCFRNIVVQFGHIGSFAKGRVQLRDIGRGLHARLGTTHSWSRKFKAIVTMMVDTASTAKRGAVVDVLPEKEEDGGYSSGGWKSEDGRLSCGYSSFRGKRASMEDFYDVKTSKIDGQTVCLFGIFDGHGGSRAAEFLKEHLFENLLKHPQFMTGTKLAISAFKFPTSHCYKCVNLHAATGLHACSKSGNDSALVQDPTRVGVLHRILSFPLMYIHLIPFGNLSKPAGETYLQTDMDFLDAESNTYRDDGSTASTAVLVGNHLYVANVGDSRTVISKGGKAIPLSEDHKPNRSDERKRIESAGGVVMWAGTWRVGGVLAMSRAFGNRLLKQFVVAEPEIQAVAGAEDEQEIDDEFEFLVLASDGLWDVVPNEVSLSLSLSLTHTHTH